MIVLDTSAIIEMSRQSPEGWALENLMLEGEKAISCELLRVEATSVVRKLVRAGKIAPDEAPGYLEKTCALVDEFVPIKELQTEALREGIRLNHFTYDMYYFILARRCGATLFTLDRKLIDLCIENGVDCIADEPLESKSPSLPYPSHSPDRRS